MAPRSVSMMFAAACAAASAAAHALPFSDKASIAVFGADNLEQPGMLRGQVRSFAGGSVVYEQTTFADAYRPGLGIGAEFGYDFSSRVSAYARAAYDEFDGQHRDIGMFSSPVSGESHVGARFGDNVARQLDVGGRYTFAPDARVRPFVGAALGATRLSAETAHVDNLATGGTTRVELARGGTLFEQRAEAGLQVELARNVDLNLTAAASHIDANRESHDPNLALVGIDDARGALRAHWDFPAEIGASWRF